MLHSYFLERLFDEMWKRFDKDYLWHFTNTADDSDTIEVEIDDEKPSKETKSPIDEYFHEWYKEFVNGEKVCEKEKEVINGEVTKDTCTKKEIPEKTNGINVDDVMKKYQQQLEANLKLTSELESLKKELEEVKASKSNEVKENESEVIWAQYNELSEEMRALQEKMNNIKKKMEE